MCTNNIMVYNSMQFFFLMTDDFRTNTCKVIKKVGFFHKRFRYLYRHCPSSQELSVNPEPDHPLVQTHPLISISKYKLIIDKTMEHSNSYETFQIELVP